MPPGQLVPVRVNWNVVFSYRIPCPEHVSLSLCVYVLMRSCLVQLILASYPGLR